MKSFCYLAINIIFTVSPSDIIMHPISTTVNAAGKAVFKCVIKGYGNISVEWKKLGSLLPITATVHNENSLNTVKSTLEIHETIGYYKGRYYCTASNDGGSVNSTAAFLNVSGMSNYFKYFCITSILCC